jgi:hypothetical protein
MSKKCKSAEKSPGGSNEAIRSSRPAARPRAARAVSSLRLGEGRVHRHVSTGQAGSLKCMPRCAHAASAPSPKQSSDETAVRSSSNICAVLSKSTPDQLNAPDSAVSLRFRLSACSDVSNALASADAQDPEVTSESRSPTLLS